MSESTENPPQDDRAAKAARRKQRRREQKERMKRLRAAEGVGARTEMARRMQKDGGAPPRPWYDRPIADKY